MATIAEAQQKVVVAEHPHVATLILNVRAGAIQVMATPRATLEAALRAAGYVLAAKHDLDESPEEQWHAFLQSPTPVVFVAGGDGTLRDAAARLIGGETILAPLPGGTMNRLCVQLGLPVDPLAAIDAYKDARVANLAVGSANSIVFLYQAIVGEPTRLLRFREMQRGSGALGWRPLLCALLRGLARPGHALLLVRIDRRKRRRGQAVVVTVPAPDASPMLTVDLAQPRNALHRLRQAWRWFRGRLAEDAMVRSTSLSHLVVHSPLRAVRLSLDGEVYFTKSPVRFRLHRKALRILVARP